MMLVNVGLGGAAAFLLLQLLEADIAGGVVVVVVQGAQVQAWEGKGEKATKTETKSFSQFSDEKEKERTKRRAKHTALNPFFY